MTTHPPFPMGARSTAAWGFLPNHAGTGCATTAWQGARHAPGPGRLPTRARPDRPRRRPVRPYGCSASGTAGPWRAPRPAPRPPSAPRLRRARA